MTSQKFREWKPIEDVPSLLYLEAMHHDYEGLRFLLRGEDPRSRMLVIRFESEVGYRNINESYLIRTWAAADWKNLPSLLQVENSEWVRWLVEEAGGVLQEGSLTHYAIYTPEDCVDVVTMFEPVVKWLP